MKRFAALFLSVALILSLCACGAPAEDNATPSTTQTTTTTEPAVAFRVFRKYLEEKYGEEEAAKAQASAKALFVGGGDDANMPTTEITADKLVDGKIGILNLMVACGLAGSNGEARRLVQQGGVFVNDVKVPDHTYGVTEDMLKEGVKIRKGKKVFHKAVLA